MGSGAAWAGACRSSSAWMPRFSSLMCCSCSPPGAAPMPSRSATGAGCRSSNSPPRAGTGPALAPGVTGFEHRLAIPQWNLRLRVMIYRKHVQHESPKNFQLDLFTPDDGHFEYYAVATNLSLSLPALYAFIGGRGAQEKTIAELKGEFALDVVPTRHYGANCAWQQLSILAYNVARSFQLDTIATPRRRSRKRTYGYVLRSMRTLRFLLITRAGRLTRIGGRNVLRLAQNPATEALYARIQHALAA